MYGHTISTYGDDPASVVGQIETSTAGNVVLRVGRRVHPQSSSNYTWTQTEHVVLTPGEAEAMAYEMLEAVGLNTDDGLPTRKASDEIQRWADDTYKGDRAQEINEAAAMREL